MGQAETMMIMQKEKRWLSANEIGLILGMENINAIRRALKIMYDNNEIFRKEIKREDGLREYSYMKR